ncbi:Cytochrome P450 [Mycena kentingensis (nom. inval.)]|nr:Cytochrome P450 [Mycena kentingensis (nom. inval.)]
MDPPTISNLEPELLLHLLSLLDVISILRIGQTSKYLHDIASSTSCWLRIVRNLQRRGFLDQREDISTLPASSLVELVKRTVLGPPSWTSPDSGEQPTTRIQKQTIIPVASSWCKTQILPGGAYVLVTSGSELSCWNILTARCVWQLTPGDFGGQRTGEIVVESFAAGVHPTRGPGWSIVFVCFKDEEYVNFVQVLELEAASGAQHELLSARVPRSDTATDPVCGADPVVAGTLCALSIHPDRCLYLILDWELQQMFVLEYHFDGNPHHADNAQKVFVVALVPGHIIVQARSTDGVRENLHILSSASVFRDYGRAIPPLDLDIGYYEIGEHLRILQIGSAAFEAMALTRPIAETTLPEGREINYVFQFLENTIGPPDEACGALHAWADPLRCDTYRIWAYLPATSWVETARHSPPLGSYSIGSVLLDDGHYSDNAEAVDGILCCYQLDVRDSASPTLREIKSVPAYTGIRLQGITYSGHLVALIRTPDYIWELLEVLPPQEETRRFRVPFEAARVLSFRFAVAPYSAALTLGEGEEVLVVWSARAPKARAFTLASTCLSPYSTSAPPPWPSHSPFGWAGVAERAHMIYVVLPRRRSSSARNMLQLQASYEYGEYEFRWLEEYGMVYPIRGCFGQQRLIVADPDAVRYILNNPALFGWAATQQKAAKLFFGWDSVTLARGERHKYLRGLMNPSFTPARVKRVVGIIQETAQRLIDHWEVKGLVERSNGARGVDIAHDLYVVLADILGQTVFETEMDGLAGKDILSQIQRELVAAIANVGKAGQITEFVVGYIPDWLFAILPKLPLPGMRLLQAYYAKTEAMATKLAREQRDDDTLLGRLASATIFSRPWSGVRSEDIGVHIRTLLFAGVNTTGDTLSWTMYHLAQMVEYQAALREEVLAAEAQGREVEYEKLPLLNAFINEVLRFYPAIPLVERQAREDCVLPLSAPLNTNAGGTTREVLVRKGQVVYVAAASYQRIKSIWGKDADVFRPHRWLDGSIEEKKGNGLGPYAGLLSFLAGPGICAGYRLALLEIQVLVCALVRHFTFTLPTDERDRVRACFVITVVPRTAEGKEELLLHLFSLLDVLSVLRLGQTCKYLNALVSSTNCWLQIVRDLQRRGIIDGDSEVLCATDAVKLVKNVVLGPPSWNTPAPTARIRKQAAVSVFAGGVPQGYSWGKTQMLPGGSFVLVVTGNGALSCWHLATGKRVWTFAPSDLDGKVQGDMAVEAFAAGAHPTRGPGWSTVFVLMKDERYVYFVELLEVEPTTGFQRLLLSAPVPQTDTMSDTICTIDPVISGTLSAVCIHPDNCLYLVFDWELQEMFVLEYKASIASGDAASDSDASFGPDNAQKVFLVALAPGRIIIQSRSTDGEHENLHVLPSAVAFQHYGRPIPSLAQHIGYYSIQEHLCIVQIGSTEFEAMAYTHAITPTTLPESTGTNLVLQLMENTMGPSKEAFSSLAAWADPLRDDTYRVWAYIAATSWTERSRQDRWNQPSGTFSIGGIRLDRRERFSATADACEGLLCCYELDLSYPNCSGLREIKRVPAYTGMRHRAITYSGHILTELGEERMVVFPPNEELTHHPVPVDLDDDNTHFAVAPYSAVLTFLKEDPEELLLVWSG